MSFNVLPNELLEHVFAYCDRNDQLTVGLVCHRWAHAVESLLLRRTCLKVSYGVRRYGHYDQTLMIDEAVLEQSTRQYTCLRIEWGDGESARSLAALHHLLDICQERFPVRRLFIRGTPDQTLARIFENRRTWLQDLLELHVELGSPYDGRSTDNAFCELSLPKLQKLTWLEIETSESEPGTWEDRETDIFYDEWYAFAVIAPELSKLKVRMNSKLMRSTLRKRSKLNGICDLFLPSLELKTFPKLQNVEIEGLFEVNRKQLKTCETFLQNLNVLSFVMCHSNVIKKICHRCCNLRELTIVEPMEGLLSFQISQTLSPVLEKFTFKAIYHSFARNDRAVFPKLRYLKLEEMCIGLILGNVPLVAPQLSTFIAPQSDYCQLVLPHKEHIRTMAMELDSLSKELATPPPNVTELLLRLTDKYDVDFSVPEYLKGFPNLRRLTLAGVDKFVVDGALLIGTFPHMEYFHAHRLRFNLADFRKMASLQSIILTECTIVKQPGDDDDAPIKVSNYFRAELVTIEAILEGTGNDVVRFPIGTNELQPPIEPVGISVVVDDDDGGRRRNVFSSRQFHMRLPDEFQHIVKREAEPTVRFV